MEAANKAEKLMSENLNKCRCCFRMLIDDRKAAPITEDIRLQFLYLTQIELLESPLLFAERICQLCASDLLVFDNLRQDLIVKQKALYELAGLEENDFTRQNSNPLCEEVDIAHEEMSEFEMQQYESMDQDDESAVYLEEQIMSDEQEAEEDVETVIRIEKIKNEEEGESTSYDFFEEIVAFEADDEKQSDGEYFKYENAL